MFGTKIMDELRPEDRKWLEEWSGGIPILLQGLLGVGESQKTPEILHSRGTNAPGHATVVGRTSRSGRSTPSAVADMPAGSGDDQDATFGGMADQLVERFQLSQAVEEVRFSISAFYGHHMHKLKGQHPSTWTK